MEKRQQGSYLLSLIDLTRDATKPLYAQLYDGLRLAILNGKLNKGLRLPSTRDLASLLDVSRNTVKSAYEQLEAEGYLTTQPSSGTFVSTLLPDELLHVPQPAARTTQPGAARTLSFFGEAAQRAGEYVHSLDVRYGRRRGPLWLTPGEPALDHFPSDTWARLSAKAYRQQQAEYLSVVPARAGYAPLRAAIADYITLARNVNCTPEQVVITSSAQQGLYLAALCTLNRGESAWVEEPGYYGVSSVVGGRGAIVTPVPVDKDGLNVDHAQHSSPDARVAFVTPAHQYPLGSTMSLPRRLALLQWAAESGGWIVEDDYDSEYRYVGRPLASLQGLDAQGCVLYVGTMSKVLFPTLRIGYLIVPDTLVDAIVGAKMMMEPTVSLVNQMVLAEFIESGHFTRHIRRMRMIYAERRAVFLDAMERYVGDAVQLGSFDCGMHVVGWLAEWADEEAVTRRAHEAGLGLYALGPQYNGRAARDGLVLGFANTPPEQMQAAVGKLADALGK